MMDAEDEEEVDATRGEKLQLRLLLLDDNQRSDLMWRQVTAFQEKVTFCLNTFNPETLLLHVRLLASLPNQNSLMASSIHSLARLRMVVQQQLRRASMRSDGSIYFTAQQESSVVARCTQYFVWFFDFMDYLNELHTSFVERIFVPLFKFFHEISFLGSQERGSTSTSTFSKLSQMSLDSADTDDTEDVEKICGHSRNGIRDTENVENTVSGHHNRYGGRDTESSGQYTEDIKTSSSYDLGRHGSGHEGEGDAEMDRARRRAQSRAALMMLSKEFADIKTLYDTTEMDRLAQALSFLKEQVDFMLEEEDELDPDLFSMESGQLVMSLHMDEGTENLVRLPADLLLKLRRMGRLAGKWLTLWDARTRDLSSKLSKVQALQSGLSRRLHALTDNIARQERSLQTQAEDLQRLMSREERSEALNMLLYDVEARRRSLKMQLQTLRIQRDTISTQIVDVTRKGQAHKYRVIKVEWEKNKLQRYLIERQLATLNYQHDLSQQDRQVELQVRPSLIRHTNHVQDTCERLEQTIQEQKRERDNIRNALLPLQEDCQTLRDKLSRSSSMRTSHDSGKTALSAGQARFIRTYTRVGSDSSAKTALHAGRARFVRTCTDAVHGHTRDIQVNTVKSARSQDVRGWMTPPQW